MGFRERAFLKARSLGGLTGATEIYTCNRRAASAKTDARTQKQKVLHDSLHSTYHVGEGGCATESKNKILMQHIGNIQIEVKKTKATSERADVISQFIDRLNENLGGRKPFKPSFIAFKMAHMTLQQLYEFLASCKEANNFGKFWWWSLDTKKHLK